MELLETITEIGRKPGIVHCSSLIETAEDSELAVWYQGSYETASDTVIMISRKKNNSSWEKAEVLFDFHGSPLGNPVIWKKKSSQRIFITFSLLTKEDWKSSLLFYSWSDDNGTSWSAPTLFLSQPGFMAKTKPIEDNFGRLLFPLYHERDYCPYIYIIDDVMAPLGSPLSAETMARNKAIQPTLSRIDSSRLIMLCRTNKGNIWKSISFNEGSSWSILRPIQLENPDSAIDVFSLKEGIIGLVYNPSQINRNHLGIAVSRDGGENWENFKTIVKGEGEFSYPSVHVRRDNTISVSFTDNRYAIRRALFSQKELLYG